MTADKRISSIVFGCNPSANCLMLTQHALPHAGFSSQRTHSSCLMCLHRRVIKIQIVQVCDRMMPGYGEQMRAISLK